MRKITQYDLIQEYISYYTRHSATEYPNYKAIGRDGIGRTMIEVQNELKKLGEDTTVADVNNLLRVDIGMNCFVCNRDMAYGIELPGDEYNMYFCPDCVDKMYFMME